MTATTETAPAVGTLATYHSGSDCYPAIVTDVSATGRSITIKTVDYVIAADNIGVGTGHSRYIRASEGDLILGSPRETDEGTTFTLRKNGRFVPKGQPMNGWGAGVSFGDAVLYRDPHF